MGSLQIAETPESERLLTKEQVVQQLSDFSFDFGFNQILAITDSTKLVLNMMMDAFQPFMGEYYQARFSIRICGQVTASSCGRNS